MRDGSESAAAPQAGAGTPWLLFAVTLALLVFASHSRSLWGDEFHALHHVETEGIGAFLASVKADNHPPLAFFLPRLTTRLLGVSDFALRLPTFIVGLLFLRLFVRLTRRLPGTASRIAPWLVPASSYCLVLFTEARMYPLLMLATLGVLVVLVRAVDGNDGDRASPWWLAFWIAVGLHSHYYFVHTLAIAGIALASGALFGLFPAIRLRPLVLPGLVGLASFVPWGLYGFREQLGHDLPPGGAEGTLMTLLESVLHFFFWQASVGGEWLVRWVAKPGAVLAAVVLLVGAWRFVDLWRAAPAERPFLFLLAAFGAGLLFHAWLVSQVMPRATFGWRYVAGAAAPVFSIAALALARSRLLQGLLFLPLAVVTLAVARSAGREDHRGLVAFVLEHAQEGDCVVVKPPWDPDPLRHETSWRYYVDRARVPEGRRVPPDYGFGEDDLARARGHERVWVWFRDPYYGYVRRSIRAGFAKEETWEMGPGMVLHLFSDPRGDG